jgi:hypothetical protein
MNRNGTENGTEWTGSGIENGRAFVHPYLRYPVFNRDIPFFVPFFFNTGWACWACFFLGDVGPVGPWKHMPELLLFFFSSVWTCHIYIKVIIFLFW